MLIKTLFDVFIKRINVSKWHWKNCSTFASFLPLANEVCEGYVFTDVCLSTGEGVCIQKRRRGVCIGGGVAQTPPPSDTTGYSQQAGGTHPTGIHSCWKLN